TDKTRQEGLDQIEGSHVNLVKLTNLMMTTAAMPRVAREITSDRHNWFWDNCSVRPGEIVAASIETVLEPYCGRLMEAVVHGCWHEAVIRTHSAAVDGLARAPVPYCITCFKERLDAA